MRWGTIVAGVDASPGGVRAAQAAGALADAAAAPCRLVHAIPDVAQGLSLRSDEVLGQRAQAVRAARRSVMIELRAARTVHSGRVEIRWGKPAAVLRDFAARAHADTVVLGARQRPGSTQWTGGVTAQRLARIADVPLMAAVPQPVGIRCVLAAVDLSPATQATVAAAERFALAFGAALRVVHVVEAVPPPTALAHAAWETMGGQVAPLVTMPDAEFVIRTGPARVILMAEVARWGADLLVVGSHGWGYVDRTLVGGLTERLLSHLPCSVVVVPIAAMVRPSPSGRLGGEAKASAAPAV